jgi:hypothetical protein
LISKIQSGESKGVFALSAVMGGTTSGAFSSSYGGKGSVG